MITKKHLLAFSTALDLCLAASAFAQQAAPVSQAVPTPRTKPAAHGPVVTDVIVTARRVQERLQDVPISITVFNQKQLTNLNVVNAQDLATSTPSLSANSNFGSQNSTFAIRGFVQDNGTPPSVGTYFADVVAPRGPTQGTAAGDGAGPGNFFDLQNVQVLKGPQGTLFGRNTTGGAVLFVPQKPTSKLGGYIEESIGNYGEKRTQGAFNLPVNDKIRFRFAIDHQDRDGYEKNDSGIGPSRFGDVGYTSARASLVVDVTPDIENYSIFSYTNSDTNGDVQKVIACNPTLSAANFLGLLTCAQLGQEKAKHAGFYTIESDLQNPESRLIQFQGINTTTWHATDTLTLKNIASYGQLRDTDASALFGTNWQLPAALGGATLPFTFIEPIAGGLTADESTITDEVQAQGSALNERLTYTAGLYYETSLPLTSTGNQSQVLIGCTDAATYQCTPLLGPESAVNYTAGQTRYRDIGAYAQASYKITDQLTATAGFRYTWDEVKNESSRITNIFPATNFHIPVCTDSTSSLPGCYENLKEKSSAPTGMFDLDYKPFNDMLLYAKYARGYRSGGVFPNSPSNYREFQPEAVDDFELGMKTTFRGAVPGTFDIDAFYNNFANQQLQVGFDGAPGKPISPTTGIVNAGKSRIFGAEVEASISPFVGLSLQASYTYLNAAIQKISALTSNDPNYVIDDQIVAGKSLELSPRNKLALTGTYVIPLDPEYGQVSVGATFTFTDSQLTSYAYYAPTTYSAYGSNLGILPPTQLLNLNAAWNSIFGKPVDLTFFATNVTDRKYYAYVPGLASAGFESGVLGQPCFYGFRLRYRFGA